MRPGSAAFTLIELLVVLFIICLLIATASIAFQHARDAAWREKARDTARQLAFSWNTRLSDDHEFPSGFQDIEDHEGGDLTFPTIPTNMALLNININSRTYMEQSAEQLEYGLRDKWKRHFHVRIDANYDGSVNHPVLTGRVVRANVVVWSGGKRPGVAREAIVVW